jgi:hypothetical protein
VNLAKLDDAEIAANRNGSSNDRKADATDHCAEGASLPGFRGAKAASSSC